MNYPPVDLYQPVAIERNIDLNSRAFYRGLNTVIISQPVRIWGSTSDFYEDDEITSVLHAAASQSVNKRIKEISQLPSNWDGPGTIAPPEDVISNLRNCIKLLPRKYICSLSEDSIMPTSYGTISLTLEIPGSKELYIEFGKDLFSYEIIGDSYPLYEEYLDVNKALESTMAEIFGA